MKDALLRKTRDPMTWVFAIIIIGSAAVAVSSFADELPSTTEAVAVEQVVPEPEKTGWFQSKVRDYCKGTGAEYSDELSARAEALEQEAAEIEELRQYVHVKGAQLASREDLLRRALTALNSIAAALEAPPAEEVTPE